MATEPIFSVPLTEFVAALLAERELTPRARLIAQQVSELIPDSAVAVYVVEDQQAPSWRLKAYIGDISLEGEVPIDSGTLGAVAEQREALQFEVATLTRDQYAHLDVRQNITSLAYVPILLEDTVLGCVELVNFDQTLPSVVLESLAPLAECAAIGIATALTYEAERNAGLQSITRLTQLYDIEKVFNATLEMQSLWPLICSKVQALTDATGVNLWMVDDDDLLLVQQAGVDPTSEVGGREVEGAGIPGAVSANGEPLLLEGDDQRLVDRNREAGDTPVTSLMAAPLMDGESLVGVLEVVSCDPLPQFDEDHLFTLVQVAGSAAQALHNASLLEAERKVEILHTLVSVSNEITSTLNLERMLQTIVNAPQAVIPYERAAIALDERGRCKLGAVTGLTQVNADAPDVAPLYDILQWAMLSNEVVHVIQRGDQVDADREETRAKFERYFQESGMRGFYASVLRDDTGLVGVLALESSDPDFLSPAHLEILQVLAGQATVALRNAQMYKDVPFISVLEPVLQKKRQFMAMEKRRRALMIAAVGAVIIFLAGFPWVLRVEGDAVVAPIRSAKLQPEIEGVVSQVYVREGDRVTKGQVIAELADWERRMELSESQAKYQSALLQMNRALAANDGTEAGVQRVQADYWKAEVARDQERLDLTQLRSPIDGVVATPDVETMVGRRLQYGDTFAEVVDTSQAIVDLAIDDTDIGLVRTGERASIKLNSFPMRILRGDVVIVSPQGAVVGDSRVFYARVAVPNSDGSIHAGMEGRGKVRTGWYPAGYALFRRQWLWLYSKAWAWFGV